jgi:hypothetical protein
MIVYLFDDTTLVDTEPGTQAQHRGTSGAIGSCHAGDNQPSCLDDSRP